MKIFSLDLKNFRCFENETFAFNSYNPLVGANNSGKSTVLRALDVFFQSTPKTIPITSDDFCASRSDDVLEIGIKFYDLTNEEEIDFGHYARGKRLHFILRSKIDSAGSITSSITGVRLARKSLALYFEAATVAEKKTAYEQLRSNGEISENWKNEETSSELIAKLDQSDPSQWDEIESNDRAYGAIGPIPKIKKYIDWIYVPAVKEASEEASENRNSAFSKLVLKAIRNRIGLAAKISELQEKFKLDLEKALGEDKQPLTDLGYELTKEFRYLTSTHIDVEISWDSRKSLVDLDQPAVRTQFIDENVRAGPEYFGHGLQRTYIMALLPLVARYSSQNIKGPRLLLGIEEPELYQHPPQARFLANSLTELSDGNAQVILTTHSPFFVSARKFNEIILIRRNRGKSTATRWTSDEHRSYYAKIIKDTAIGQKAAISSLDKLLQPTVSELFFSNRIIFVEGPEDIALISTYLKLTDRWNNFLRHGGCFIPTNGKAGLPSLITLARGFSIPHFVIFDFDMNLKPKERSNHTLAKFLEPLGFKLPDEINSDIHTERFSCWKENIQESINSSCSEWRAICIQIAEEWGWTIDRMKKDPMLLEEAASRALSKSDTIPALEELSKSLMRFCSD